MLRKSVLLLLVFILSACNFPTQQLPRLEETLQAGYVQTAAALTAVAPFETPAPPELPVPLVQAPGSPLVQAPGVQLSQAQPVHYSVPVFQTGLPVVTVNVNTNCRTGPARAYSLIGWLLVGEQAVVVGQNQRLNYWIIQNPRGPGTCWLWGRYAAVFGDISQVPHVEFPAPGSGVPITGPAYLNALVPTNCYTGPGTQFPVLGILQSGQLSPFLGRDASGVWWLIQHPGSIGQCWVWGGVQITGNVAVIPVVPGTGPTPVPPLPPQPPSAAHYLAVSVNTNCRTGPSTQFPIVNTLRVGQFAPVLARNWDASWWLIQNPNQAGLSCWVWGRYATLWGDFGTIPVVPPTGVTPIPTPIPPTPIPPTPIPPLTPVGQPFLMTSVNTNCRTGPSARQPIVGTLLVGQQALIYGRNIAGDWWYVQLPTFPEVQCWVWGQNAIVYGDWSEVPVLPVIGLGITPGVPEVDPAVPQVVPVVPQVDPAMPVAPVQPAPPAPQAAPISPWARILEWFRGPDTPQPWAPTLAPPQILIQPVVPTPQSPLIQPIQPTPPLVQPIQPTPVPPLVQPVVPQILPTAEPVLPTPIPPVPAAPAAPVGAEECIMLDQSVVFGQVFLPNTPFEARWRVLNTGAATWNPGEVNVRYLSGDVVHTTAEVPLAQAVPPGGIIDISVPAVAPAAAQNYSALWGVTRGAEVLCNLFIVIEVP
jgi:uncharacterized protein YraI